MNKRTSKNFQSGLQPNSEQKADKKHVCPAIGNTMLAAVQSELDAYLSKHNIQLGKWYSSGGFSKPLQLVGFREHYYWGDCLVFSDKTLYRISLPFWWVECDEPKEVIKEIVVDTTPKKERDTNYYKLKQRHELLCSKKLELNRQGKNTTMRNAYINQELDWLRSQLREYASE